MACGLKFHWMTFISEAKLRQPTGQRQENFKFGPSLLKLSPQIPQKL